jgi:arylsulfatase A-like enzyme
MEPVAEKVVVGAEKAIPEILSWLGKSGGGPAMIWAHLLDPHYPYVKGNPKARAYERYLAEVAHTDAQIGKLVAAAGNKRLRRRVYFVISADHGEAFGEHGTRTHASTVYEEQVRVPMIIAGPGVVPRAIDQPVSVIDLGATMLDLFGLDTPGSWMGESLVPLLAGEDVALTRPIVLDAGRRKQGIVFDDGIKAIRNLREKTREAYDLRADPKEADDLTESRPTLAAERLEAVRAFFDVHERKAPGYEVPYRE